MNAAAHRAEVLAERRWLLRFIGCELLALSAMCYCARFV